MKIWIITYTRDNAASLELRIKHSRKVKNYHTDNGFDFLIELKPGTEYKHIAALANGHRITLAE